MASFSLKPEGESSSIGIDGASAIERYVVEFDETVEAIGDPYDVAFARKPPGTLHSNAQLAKLAVVVQGYDVVPTSAPDTFYVDVSYGQSISIPFSGLWSFSKIGTLETEPYAIDARGQIVGGNVWVKPGEGQTPEKSIPIPGTTKTLDIVKLSRNVAVRAASLTRTRPISAFTIRGENLVTTTRNIRTIDFYKSKLNSDPFLGYSPHTVKFAHDAWESAQQTVGLPQSGGLLPAGVFNVELTFEVDSRGWVDKLPDTVDLPDGHGNVYRVILPGTDREYFPYRSVPFSGMLAMFSGLPKDRPIGLVRR